MHKLISRLFNEAGTIETRVNVHNSICGVEFVISMSKQLYLNRLGQRDLRKGTITPSSQPRQRQTRCLRDYVKMGKFSSSSTQVNTISHQYIKHQQETISK